MLKHGKLVPPESLAVARRAQKRLAADVARIEQQLGDPQRRSALPEEAYATWRLSAESALELRRVEAKQLDEWVAERQSSDLDLLLEAREIFRKQSQEFDLEPEEEDFVARLELRLTQSSQTQTNNRRTG